jgi:hypothetical protein
MKPLLVLAAAGALAACQAAANPYPSSARAEFDSFCRMGVAECACAWKQITAAMPHAEYQAALETFKSKGVMDPRIVRASVACRT